MIGEERPISPEQLGIESKKQEEVVEKGNMEFGPVLVDDGKREVLGRRVSKFELSYFGWRGYTDNQLGILNGVYFRTEGGNLYLVRPIRDKKDIWRVTGYSILEAGAHKGAGRNQAQSAALRFETRSPSLNLNKGFEYQVKVGVLKSISLATTNLREIVAVQTGTMMSRDQKEEAKKLGRESDIAKEFWQIIETK